MRAVSKVVILACVFTLVTMVDLAPFVSISTAFAGSKKITLNIKGMKDYASTIKIKEALTAVKGVKKAHVDFRNERAIVTVKKGTDLDDLIGAVKKAGFRAYPAEKVESKKKRKKREAEEEPYKGFEKDDAVGP